MVVEPTQVVEHVRACGAAGTAEAQRSRRPRRPASAEAGESLENAIEELRQPGGRLRGSLNLEDADVLAPIPSMHHLLDGRDASRGRFVFEIRDTGVCEYEFRPHDPVGWVMTSGNPARDGFAGDAMSSKGVWG